jgi:hypothetical protein
VAVSGDETVELNETFLVNLSGLAAGGRAVSLADDQGQGTIENDDSATLSINDVSLAEGDSGTTNLVFTVTLSAAVDTGLSVNYATADGTASAPGDYTAASGTLNFLGDAGETQTITVAVSGDTLDEPDETFFVDLSGLSASGRNVTVSDTQGLGTILDDDPEPTVAFVLAADSNSELLTSVPVTVALSAPSGKTVTVNYAVTAGTATGGGVDYTLASGTLTFNPGVTEQIITVQVVDDELDEFDETIVISLSSPSNATLGAPSTHTYTILDNDAPPSLTINNVPVLEGDSGTVNAVFTVSLSAPSGKTITVDYTTADGTASAGSDYTAASGTLTINPGDESTTITVQVQGDTEDEPDETFLVNLSNPVNVSIADGQGVGTILDDDEPPTGENRPPVLAEIDDQVIGEGSVLHVFASATDPDGDTLTFSLDAAPEGAVIDPATGEFSWRPADGLVPPESFVVTVRVTDSGTPALSDTESFLVTVLNVAPNGAISGPKSGHARNPIPQTFRAADPSSVDRTWGFRYVIDWGDRTPLEEVDGGSAVSLKHTYDRPGSYTITMTATDKDGGTSAPVSRTIEVRSSHPLRAAQQGLAPSPAALTQAAAEAFTPHALALWASALGRSELPDVEVAVADLTGDMLGFATVLSSAAGVVTLDRDAAGHGWFIDPTPWEDSEFPIALGGESLLATDSPAAGRIDLLTVLAHELGHLLGFEHAEEDGLMAATLAPGVRHRPDHDHHTEHGLIGMPAGGTAIEPDLPLRTDRAVSSFSAPPAAGSELLQGWLTTGLIAISDQKAGPLFFKSGVEEQPVQTGLPAVPAAVAQAAGDGEDLPRESIGQGNLDLFFEHEGSPQEESFQDLLFGALESIQTSLVFADHTATR